MSEEQWPSRPEIMQEAFCQAYVADASRNATKAAVAAGYSEKTARTQASMLLTRLNIKARIRELEREALRNAGYDPSAMSAAVMREYVRIAFSDITDVIHVSPGRDDPDREQSLRELAELNGGQRVLDFGETLVVPTVGLPSDATAAIKGIKCSYGKSGFFEGFEISLHDKMNALRVLAEASGVIKNTLALTGSEGGPVALRWAEDEPEEAAARVSEAEAEDA
jgi:phage terminase small subunit